MKNLHQIAGNEVAEKLPHITLKAIGIIRNDIKQSPGPGYNWRNVASEIVIDSSLSEALDGIDEFSHIIVIFWMHQIAAGGQEPNKVHPQGRQDDAGENYPRIELQVGTAPCRNASYDTCKQSVQERNCSVQRRHQTRFNAIGGDLVCSVSPTFWVQGVPSHLQCG